MSRPPYISRPWNIVLPYSSSMMTVAGNVAGIVPTPTLQVIPWRPNIPRQIYICGARVGHQTAPTGLPSGPGTFGQFAIAIDYDRAAFNAGVPPWYQQKPDGSNTDWDENLTLCSLFSRTSEGQERTRDWHYPAAFDADKDLLWIQQDAAEDQWWAQLAYLAPAEFDVLPYPAPPPPPPPPPEPGWQIVAQVNPDGEAAYGGYTFSSALDSIVSGGDATRLTIAAGSTGCTLNSLYVGPRSSGHSAASLASVLPSPVSIAANGQHVVEIPSALSGAVIVRGYVAAGKLRSKAGVVSGWSSAHKAGDFASALDGSTFTTGTAASNGLTRIEKFYP